MLRNLRTSLQGIHYSLAVAATLVAFLSPVQSFAQSQPRISGMVDDAALVTLKGNTHPLANAKFDQGPADESLSGRMLLVLKRSPLQEQSLKSFVEEQSIAGSENFHRWLTPEQFGQQFGVDDTDIQTVSAYLTDHGFTVGRVYKSKMAIEVSGTAAQIRDTFHTEIHSYAIGGHQYYANATDPKIPAALAPVVAGFASLNNIREDELRAARPKTVQATFEPKSHTFKPEFTGSVDGSTYIVTPSDLQTIYSIQAGKSNPGEGGAGVTVGVIGDSQVNLSLITTYQTVTGGAANPPNEIVDGNDPAILTTGTDATIAYEQLELLSAAAPNATINYYVSATTDYDTGLDFSIIRAVDDNAASVLTIGFQSCETTLGSTLNEFIEEVWLQAAAQGITVVAAAGDSGSAACDTPGSATSSGGLAVNGYASTPYDTAVGGTDFYYGPTGSANAGTYWSTTNNADYGSAKGYIPEQAWNDSYLAGGTNSNAGTSILYAGGGGLSSTAVATTTVVGGVSTTTYSGYPVPTWQSSFATGARTIPDVSFFAGNNFNLAQYAVCSEPGQCVIANITTTLTLTGGTAGAAAVFAGIMAEVVEKYGAQGNANYALYNLHATAGVFNDVKTGNNAAVCSGGTGCTGGYLQSGGAAAYPAVAGYDKATGLGSINGSTLVADWSVPAKTASSTAFSILCSFTTTTPGPCTANAPATSVVHGTYLNLTATVTGSGPTPTGAVAFTTNSLLPTYDGVLAVPLNSSGIAASTDDYFLPGGSYNVTANYSGDSTYTPSSKTVGITVTPEPSRVLLFSQAASPGNVATPYPASGSSVPYGTPVFVTAEPFSLNNNNVSTPTGTLSVIENGASYPSLLMPLNSEGTATFSSSLLAPGSYSLSFSYSGDASFGPSKSGTLYSVTVTQATTNTSLSATGNAASPDEPVTLTATVQPTAATPAASIGVPPTGSVTFSTSATAVPLVSGFNTAGQAIATATTTVASTQAGSITATYSGDTNYSTSTSSATTIGAATSGGVGTTFTLTPNATTIAENGTLTLTAKAVANTGFACQVYYDVTSQYAGGFQVGMNLYNTGSVGITNWTLTWTFANGQKIAQFNNGIESQTGGNVTVTNETYNGTIAAGGSVTGLQFGATWNNVTNSTPTNFAINGTPCSSGTGTTASLAGNVQLYANGVALSGDTFAISAGGTGTYTVPLVNNYLPFASGNVVLTGVYTPTSSAYAAASGATSLTVTDDRTTADFSMSTDSALQVMSPSSSNVFFQVQLTSIANFAGLNKPIALGCTVPANSNLICTLSAPSVTIGSSGIAITNIELTGYPTGAADLVKPVLPNRHWWLYSGGAALAFICLFGIPARRKAWRGVISMMVCVMLIGGSISGCGNGALSNATQAASSGGGGEPTGGGGTAGADYDLGGVATNNVAPGTYHVVFTGTATTNTTLVHNVEATVVVTRTPTIQNATFTLSSTSSHLLVTDPGASTTAGQQIEQYTADGTNDQNWVFTYVGGGYYTIQNAGNNLYLTDPNGVDSTSPYTITTETTRITGTYANTQLWTLVGLQDGYEIVNEYSGGVLDDDGFGSANGTPVLCYPQKSVNQGINQTWYVQPN